MTRPGAGSDSDADQGDAATARALQQRLRLIRQGDVISLGATNIVGRGPTPIASEASGGQVAQDQVWALTVVSELGYYVVLSQDCDIVRDVDVEPCLLVCPAEAVPLPRWEALRRGPYSPREFPLPQSDALDLPRGTAAIANLRFATSLDKAALLAPGFEFRAPLRSAGVRERFATWLGRRAARAPHSDELERDVLAAAGDRVRTLAKQFRKAQEAGKDPTPTQKLVGAAEEWFLAPGEQLVPFQMVISPASADAAGLWDNNKQEFREQLLEQARKSLAADLSKRATAGLGYTVTVELHTLDRVSALMYRSWSEWTWENEPPWPPDGDD